MSHDCSQHYEWQEVMKSKHTLHRYSGDEVSTSAMSYLPFCMLTSSGQPAVRGCLLSMFYL